MAAYRWVLTASPVGLQPRDGDQLCTQCLCMNMGLPSPLPSQAGQCGNRLTDFGGFYSVFVVFML